MVEDVERVDAQPQPYLVRQGDVLRERHVSIVEARADNGIARQVSEGGHCGNTDVSNQRFTSPNTWMGPDTSGRTVFGNPVRALLFTTMLIGFPLWPCTTAATSHPSIRLFPLKGNR